MVDIQRVAYMTNNNYTSPPLLIRGPSSIQGEVEVMGAKNGALKAFAAALLSDDPMRIEGVPIIEDIARQVELVEGIGGEVEWDKESHTATVKSAGVRTTKLSPGPFQRIRGGMALTGPLLARFGEVHFPEPGGCSFGRRPIDRFLRGFVLLGADVFFSGGYYHVSARAERLQGARIVFPEKSVVATETLMMAAVLAEGKTVLVNAACEPEIPNLAGYLNAHGARIEGAGTPTITIEGVRAIRGGTFVNIPDRLEAAFFTVAAVAVGGTLRIVKCVPEHLEALLEVLREMGAQVEWGSDWISVHPSTELALVPKVKTSEYPGLNTDQQPFLTTLLTQAKGQALVFETIHEGRLNVVDSLNKMGAKIITCDPHRIVVSGPTPLQGKPLVCLDARTANAFLIAGMIAEGETVLTNTYQLHRGFERLPERLRMLGVDIQEVSSTL